MNEHVWEVLVGKALLGTERSGGMALPGIGRPTDSAASAGTATDDTSRADDDGGIQPMARLESALGAAAAVATNQERLLMMQAALVDIHRRAGTSPSPGDLAVLVPSGVETLSECPPAAVARLKRILAGAQRELLGEWLRTAREAQIRLPPTLLVTTLELSTANPALRPDMRAVIGERGRWLASLRRDWAWATVPAGGSLDDEVPWPEDAEEHFQLGTPPQRLAAFESCRQADSGRAREMLTQSWAEESPEDRRRFIQAFTETLGNDDEPFLEAALSDRRKPVRAAATEVLARLPGSRLAARMCQILSVLTTLQGRHDERLEVSVPIEVTKDMERDGIDPKASSEGGTANGWLRQVVARAPLGWWLDHTGSRSAGEVIGMLADDEAGKAVRRGMVEAAATQMDIAWAMALARALPANETAQLAPLWPDDLLEDWLRVQMAGTGLEGPPSAAVTAMPSPLSPAVSRLVLGEVLDSLGKPGRRAGIDLRWIQHGLPSLIHPEVCEQASELLQAASSSDSGRLPATVPAIDRALDALQFRMELRRELLGPDPQDGGRVP